MDRGRLFHQPTRILVVLKKIKRSSLVLKILCLSRFVTWESNLINPSIFIFSEELVFVLFCSYVGVVEEILFKEKGQGG